MAETVDIDKLVGELDSGPKLEDLDDIFKTEPIKAAEAKKTEERQTLLGAGLTPEQERLAAAGAGAMTGMVASPALRAMIPSAEERTAAGIRTVQQRAALEQTLRDLLDQELMRAGVPPERAPATTSGEKWARNWAGQERPGVGGVPEASAAYQRSKGQGKVTGRMTKMWGPAGPNEPSALIDRLMARSAAAEAAPAAQAAAQNRAAQMVAEHLSEATPGPLSRVAGAVARPLGGALGGAGAGMSIYEAIQRYKEGDRSGAVIAALGGLAGMVSMAPGLGLAGTAVGLGTLPAQYINDVLKGRTEATVPTQFDPMGNPIQ